MVDGPGPGAARGRGGLDPGRRGLGILALTLAAAGLVFLLPPIPQDPAYHRFADQRVSLGIPNLTNVASNAGFLLVGLLGLWRLGRRPGGTFVEPRERRPYLLFFAGLTLTGVGSAYYHWAPDGGRLVWDRLPMTLAFMSVFAAVVAERVHVGLGLGLTLPLCAMGAGTVAYWRWTELGGAGDLRPYVLVQFYPVLAIPLLLALLPPRYTRGADLVAVVGLYAGAKALEGLDGAVLRWTGLVGGHALKHLAAALAGYWLLRMLERRRVAPRETLPSGLAADGMVRVKEVRL